MIEGLLEELKNPPSRFESTYELLEELYEIYVKLHDLAMDPSDNMDNHMKSVNKLADQILEKTRELDAIFVVK
jgi:hypothetical protein